MLRCLSSSCSFKAVAVVVRSNAAAATTVNTAATQHSRSISTGNCLCINCHRATISRMTCQAYKRVYPTMLVQGDGSTLSVRYHKPRKIMKLPLDLSTLTEAERQARLENRKPKTKVVIEEEIEDTFSVNDYEHLWQK